MKLSEFYDLLKEICRDGKLDQEYKDAKPAYWTIGVEWTIDGTTEYIPSKYSNGTRDDPPEAFAKEYDFQRDVEEELVPYAVKKNGNKAVFLVTTETDDSLDEGPLKAGCVEYDGSFGEGMKEKCREAGLDGSEEVFLGYGDKEYAFSPSKKDADVKKNVFGSYHGITFVKGWKGEIEPSEAYYEIKVAEFAQDIDPEQEMRDREDFYRSERADDWDN